MIRVPRWVPSTLAATCLLFASGCASLPEERQVTMQDIGQRGVAIGVIAELFLDAGEVDRASGKGLHNLLISESVHAGRTFKQNVSKAFEDRGVPVRKALFIRVGEVTPAFLKSHTCRQLASVEKYRDAASQKPSAEKCVLTAEDGRSIESALPYLTATWENTVGETMPKAVVEALRAQIDARYFLLFYYSGYERTDQVKKSHAALKVLTLLSPQGLADAAARSVAGSVDEERYYSAVVYDTEGGRLRRVLHASTSSKENYIPTDPRAWTATELKKNLIDFIVKDDVLRRR